MIHKYLYFKKWIYSNILNLSQIIKDTSNKRYVHNLKKKKQKIEKKFEIIKNIYHIFEQNSMCRIQYYYMQSKKSIKSVNQIFSENN